MNVKQVLTLLALGYAVYRIANSPRVCVGVGPLQVCGKNPLHR